MKHIEIEANGYTFDVAIKEDSPMGRVAMSLPMEDLITALTNTARDANLSPANIEEMNRGGTQVIYSLV